MFVGVMKTAFISFLFSLPCKDILIRILLDGIDLLACSSDGIGCDTLSLSVRGMMTNALTHDMFSSSQKTMWFLCVQLY